MWHIVDINQINKHGIDQEKNGKLYEENNDNNMNSNNISNNEIAKEITHAIIPQHTLLIWILYINNNDNIEWNTRNMNQISSKKITMNLDWEYL